MPLYEYQCRSCGNVSEVIQRLSDDLLSTCGECGGELKKLVSAPAFQFKGSGWYVTDYGKGNGNGKGGGSGDGGSKASSGSKGDSGSEGSSKSETKASSESPKTETKTKSESVSSD